MPDSPFWAPIGMTAVPSDAVLGEELHSEADADESDPLLEEAFDETYDDREPRETTAHEEVSLEGEVLREECYPFAARRVHNRHVSFSEHKDYVVEPEEM